TAPAGVDKIPQLWEARPQHNAEPKVYDLGTLWRRGRCAPLGDFAACSPVVGQSQERICSWQETSTALMLNLRLRMCSSSRWRSSATATPMTASCGATTASCG